MEATKFETGKLYGNDLTIEVIKRSEKTITIKSTFGTQRVKVRDYGNGVEAIMFKAWYILACEEFNKEEAMKIAMENAYYR
jgi:hypothetical protein